MKRILLVLLVLLGPQTQAQTLCDVNMTYTTGSQMQLEIAIPVTGNSLPTMAPLYAVTYGNGNMLAEDSCFSGPCTHMIYNYNPNGTYYDTLTTCISYTLTDTMGYIDTLMCCFEQYWDGSSWAKLSMQQANPLVNCDSLTTQHYPVTGISITLDTSNAIFTSVDSVEVLWTACNTSTCYSAYGMTGYFPWISLSDTVKLCYDVWVYNSNTVETCNQCDSIIHDGNSWVLMSIGNPTGIEELMKNEGLNNVTYDLMGRKVTNLTKGVMYIRNQKKFIILK